MVKIFPFAGIRPRKTDAPDIASVPYDVVTTEEAHEMIARNPRSFLAVIRSDAELPHLPPDNPEVYVQARNNLSAMIENGLLVQDPGPCLYVYRVKQAGHIYTGLVACVDAGDYEENRIRRHEHTRVDKEDDRTRHIDVTDANTGLVVLLYRDEGEIFTTIESLIPPREPDGLVKTEHGVVHELFRIDDPQIIGETVPLFADLPFLYIADGHHRAKSAVNVAEKRRREGRFTTESGRFMAILFAHRRVRIHGYSRLVSDLGPYSNETFLDALGAIFEVRQYGEIDDTVFCIPPLRDYTSPHHVIHMYLDGRWYELTCPVQQEDDPVASLDVTLLQKTVLEGMLGISDPRRDSRLQYLGGARPLADLEERVDDGEFAVAFSMQPVDIETVLSIADRGEVMPPKSTWFEPKLLSGLVLHSLR
jgi:uncharacterized protein (DUF1015 family)